MTTHTGKIARLPKNIREQLNQRLENGEKGKTLVHWLNTLPEVQKIITDQFAGHAIREQNLSEWKRGGYIDWLNRQQLIELVRWNNETSSDVSHCRDDTDISDSLACVMGAELILHTRALQKIKEPEKRWRRFRQLARELSRLRRDDHRFRRNELRREQWESTLEPLEPGGANLPASQDKEFDEQEIEAQEITEQEAAEAELEKEESADEAPEIVEPLETEDGGASVPASQSGELETPLVRHSLGDGENPMNRGASVPASHVAQAFQPAGPGTFPGPNPESPSDTSVPASNPPPNPERKKLYSDTSYRSLRHAHHYDQLSG